MYIYDTNLFTIFFSGPDDELRFNQCGKKKALQTVPIVNNKNKQRDFLCHTQLQHKTRNPTPKSKKTTGKQNEGSKQKAECRVRRRDRSQQNFNEYFVTNFPLNFSNNRQKERILLKIRQKSWQLPPQGYRQHERVLKKNFYYNILNIAKFT
jgi:hypothetical protein